MEKRSILELFLPLVVVVEVEHANEEHVLVDEEEVLLILLRALAMMNLLIEAADIIIRFVVPIIMR